MHINTIRTFAFALLILFSEAHGFIYERACLLGRGPHDIGIAPEIYHESRTRAGGSKQDGWMYGAKMIYQRRRPMAFYWLGSYRWAWGKLDGHTGSGAILKSDKYDSEGEIRFGYSLGSCYGRCYGLQVTPYIGGSLFRGHNKLREPSPITCHFRDTVEMWNTGMMATIDLSPCTRIGIDYTAKFMVEATNRITNDPIFADSESVIGNEIHHTIEIPTIVRLKKGCYHLTGGFTPFYRYRHYGFHEAFPFDYIETEFKEWGASVWLALRF